MPTSAPPPPITKPTAAPPPPLAKPPTASSVETIKAPSFGRPKKVEFQSPIIVFHTTPGFGKTTAAAYAPNPLLVQVCGETGYHTLLGAKRVPEVNTLLDEDGQPDDIKDWQSLRSLTRSLIADPQGLNTLAIDTIGGAADLCCDYICDTEFKGVRGDEGFMSFHKGYALAAGEWANWLVDVTVLRRRHNMIVLLLSHSRIATFKNPMGADYSGFSLDGNDRLWAETEKVADIILFGKFDTVVQQKPGKSGKNAPVIAVGGTTRMIYAENRDAFKAKNRYGVSASFEVPNDPAQVWSTIWSHIRGQE